MDTNNFYLEKNYRANAKLYELLDELPSFCHQYFVGIESRTSSLTRLNYAHDLKLFFNYLVENVKTFAGKNIQSLKISDLNKVSAINIEAFLSYIAYYKDENGATIFNGDRAKARKLSAIKSMFKYFFLKDMIDADISTKVATPKIRTKSITRLEVDEVVKVLDNVENQTTMSKRQQNYNKKNEIRDFAIISLFLGTGIRVSELVGMNIDDIDFNNNSFKITRKGGSQSILYFSDEIGAPLYAYYIERISKRTKEDEKALFLSMQNTRICIRAVENLVKKYTEHVVPLKNITPHKLRSTFGTNLYRETQDIYVVAEVLGHKDVNTTKTHYAAISEDIKREASTKIKLRSDK